MNAETVVMDVRSILTVTEGLFAGSYGSGKGSVLKATVPEGHFT